MLQMVEADLLVALELLTQVVVAVVQQMVQTQQ
jgi:hypothetical protein